MGGKWAAGVAGAGVLLVGVVSACALGALGDRVTARDWPPYAAVLFGPYLLAAVGCRLEPLRLVRALGALVVAAGALVAAAALFDAVPVFAGNPPPAMPASALAAVVPLLVQYTAGALAVLLGAAARSVARDARTAP